MRRKKNESQINMEVMRSAVLLKRPWEHLSIDGVLDRQLYDKVLSAWPKTVNMDHQSTLPNRYWTFIYPSNDDGFWPLLGKSLGESAELKSVVFDKLGIEESKSTFCEVRLITDTLGYKCKPHCDTAAKVVSMLLYCPHDNANSYCGTRLGEKPDDGASLVLTKVEPFIPNHAFIFAQHRLYIHWVDELTSEFLRNQILICWMCEE